LRVDLHRHQILAVAMIRTQILSPPLRKLRGARGLKLRFDEHLRPVDRGLFSMRAPPLLGRRLRHRSFAGYAAADRSSDNREPDHSFKRHFSPRLCWMSPRAARLTVWRLNARLPHHVLERQGSRTLSNYNC